MPGHRRCAVLLLAALAVVGCSLPEAPAVLLADDRAVSTSLPVPAGAQQAVVVRVTDGDTVVLRGRGTGPLPGAPTRVRVLLVDTPEVFGGAECFGAEASSRTEQLLPPGAVVRVEADRDRHDRYGRTLLHVWTPDGDNLGERLVAEGLATVLQIDPNERYLERFRAQQNGARESGAGLWSACR